MVYLACWGGWLERSGAGGQAGAETGWAGNEELRGACDVRLSAPASTAQHAMHSSSL